MTYIIYVKACLVKIQLSKLSKFLYRTTTTEGKIIDHDDDARSGNHTGKARKPNIKRHLQLGDTM